MKWSYENYRGFHAATLQNKLDTRRPDGGIEIVDARTIVFHFKDPFLNFLHIEERWAKYQASIDLEEWQVKQ